MSQDGAEPLLARLKRRDRLAWVCCLAGILAGAFAAAASHSAWVEGFAQRNSALEVVAASRGDGQEVVAYAEGADLSQTPIARIPVQHPESKQKWHIDIAYLAQKNPKSEACEVWLLNVATPDPVDWDEISHVPGWELLTHQLGKRHNTMVAGTGPPHSAVMDLTGGTLYLQFLKHLRGGMARVTVNGVSQTIDLYSPSEEPLDLVWQPQLDPDLLSPPRKLSAVVAWQPGSSRDLRVGVEPAGRGEIRSVKLDGVPLAEAAPGVFRVPDSHWTPGTWASLAAFLTFAIVAAAGALLALLWFGVLPPSGALLRSAGLLAAIAIGAFCTAVFFPGTMSEDSLDMWGMGMAGRYSNWHPIFMALVMHAVNRLFAAWPMQYQVAVVAFLQGTVLWGSIFAVLSLFVRPLRLKIAVCAAVLLYYPLWLYTVTLWKDVWFAAAFLGLLVAAWPLFSAGAISRRRWVAIATFLLLAMLNRSTAAAAFLILLVVSASAFAILGRFREARRVLLASTAALVCAMSAQTVLYRALHVSGTGNSLDFYLSYDLVGTVKFSGRPIARFANLQTYQAFGRERFERAIDGYTCGGNLAYLVYGPNPPFDQWELLDDSYALQDMPLLVLGFPGPYMKHKVCSLESLLGVTGKKIASPFFDTVILNRFGIHTQSLLPPVRERALRFLNGAAGSPGPLQVPFRHYALLLLSALASLVAIVVGWFRGSVAASMPPLYLFLGGIAVLLPMFFIVPAGDWRYLMPAAACWISSAVVAAVSLLKEPLAGDHTSP